jgi:release factor glutamine methyltransferase
MRAAEKIRSSDERLPLSISSPAEVLSGTVRRLRAAGCVFAEEEAELLVAAAAGPEHLDELVARRVAGVPLEVILGWAQFCGLRIEVDAGVFVPRQRTAFLVNQAVALARPGAVVVDLCCGTGAIGVAVASAVPGVVLHAADIDPAAVRCADRNVSTVGGRAYCGDLYDALPAELCGQVDLLLVNAPYVPTDEIEMMPPEARDHEPRPALDGGSDGVAIHRRVASSAARWLRPGGHLLIESSEHQGPLTAQAMREGGLDARVDESAELYSTVVTGTRPAGA